MDRQCWGDAAGQIDSCGAVQPAYRYVEHAFIFEHTFDSVKHMAFFG
jgi:hypothetical protein